MATAPKLKRVAYGILKPDGELYMSESCICEDKICLLEELEGANQEADGKCMIVPLYVRIWPKQRSLHKKAGAK